MLHSKCSKCSKCRQSSVERTLTLRATTRAMRLRLRALPLLYVNIIEYRPQHSTLASWSCARCAHEPTCIPGIALRHGVALMTLNRTSDFSCRSVLGSMHNGSMPSPSTRCLSPPIAMCRNRHLSHCRMSTRTCPEHKQSHGKRSSRPRDVRSPGRGMRRYAFHPSSARSCSHGAYIFLASISLRTASSCDWAVSCTEVRRPLTRDVIASTAFPGAALA